MKNSTSLQSKVSNSILNKSINRLKRKIKTKYIKSKPSGSPLMPENYSDIFIRDFMTRDVITLHEDDPIEHIFELFDKYHFNTYPVVNNEGKLTGIIDQDIMLEIIMFHRIPRTKHTHIAAVRSQGESAREIMIPHP